ncbi:MAG: hypothetical protein U0802_13115 [Candidatus Binatia bacterium]
MPAALAVGAMVVPALGYAFLHRLAVRPGAASRHGWPPLGRAMAATIDLLAARLSGARQLRQLRLRSSAFLPYGGSRRSAARPRS